MVEFLLQEGVCELLLKFITQSDDQQEVLSGEGNPSLHYLKASYR